MVDLREQIEYEKTPSEQSLPKDKLERNKYFVNHYTAQYARYLIIYRKLEECYDQILQPQKREDVRQVLEATIGRMLEIKNVSIIRLTLYKYVFTISLTQFK